MLELHKSGEIRKVEQKFYQNTTTDNLTKSEDVLETMFVKNGAAEIKIPSHLEDDDEFDLSLFEDIDISALGKKYSFGELSELDLSDFDINDDDLDE